MTDTLSPAPAFEAALTRTFGAREDFFRALTHALRRRCGGRVYLSVLCDGTLALFGLANGVPCPGETVLELAASASPCSEATLSLRVRVVDWRHCARRYEEILAAHQGR